MIRLHTWVILRYDHRRRKVFTPLLSEASKPNPPARQPQQQKRTLEMLEKPLNYPINCATKPHKKLSYKISIAKFPPNQLIFQEEHEGMLAKLKRNSKSPTIRPGP